MSLEIQPEAHPETFVPRCIDAQTISQRFGLTIRYPVHFTSDLFDPDNALLAQVVSGGRALIVVDSGLIDRTPKLLGEIEQYCHAHSTSIELTNAPLAFPGGERAKNDPQLLQSLYGSIFEARLCRHSYLIAIGGGALIDLVGFAAATAHRGVRLIRIPTTVLAQNDAAVGIKNGVNAFGRKNFLGAFAAPHAVINDEHFLATLDDRDWRAGIAEAIKVALIKDAEFFDYIESNADALTARELPPMRELIFRCAKLHLDHIATSGDPLETGTSRPLDFGHWSAHKLEQMTSYRLRHGEAVAIGIAIDTLYSHRIGLLDRATSSRVLALIERCGFALRVEEMNDSDMLLKGLKEFQEHLGGELTITLLEEIGRGIEVHSIDRHLMHFCILALGQSKTP